MWIWVGRCSFLDRLQEWIVRDSLVIVTLPLVSLVGRFLPSHVKSLGGLGGLAMLLKVFIYGYRNRISSS